MPVFVRKVFDIRVAMYKSIVNEFLKNICSIRKFKVGGRGIVNGS
jgi:hypothetical protein